MNMGFIRRLVIEFNDGRIEALREQNKLLAALACTSLGDGLQREAAFNNAIQGLYNIREYLRDGDAAAFDKSEIGKTWAETMAHLRVARDGYKQEGEVK